jgi:CheY-like chemotaxis protein
VSRLVIVADANPDRADRIREACAVRGFSTRAVATGADALESCVAEGPEVLVTVGRLALIEATKLVEILRTNPRTRRVRFVFLSDPEHAPPADWGAVLLPLEADPDEVAERVSALMERSSELDAVLQETRDEVEGRLAQIPLTDLLQLFHLNRRSGSFELRRRTADGRNERGRIYLHEGDIVQAVIGPVEGEKALFRLLTWNDGSFAFRGEVVSPPACITTTTRALLMEGMRQLDDLRRLRAELPSLDAHVSLRIRSGQLPSVVHPLTQEVLLLLELYSHVGELVDHASYPDYQVLRTLQTLVQRGIVEIRAGAPIPAPDSGLFRASQIQRLRDWLGIHNGSPRDGKLLIASTSPHLTREFLRLLRSVPGLVPHPRMGDGPSAHALGPIARVRLEDDLGIELIHVPISASYAPLWQLAGHGALGTLLLMEGPVAEGMASLRPFGDALRALPRSRLLHVLMLRSEEPDLAEEVRRHVEQEQETTLFLLPLDGPRDPLERLRSAFSRLLP